MPASPEALQQAEVFHRAGDVANAERCYRDILAVEPRQFEAIHGLGLLEAQRGRYEAALRLLGQALKIDPQSIAANVTYGNVLQALNRHAQALAICNKVLSLDPDSTLAHYNRGNVLVDLNRYAEALEDYDRVLALMPDNAAALYNRGGALQQLKRHDEALASYDRALALMPDNVEVLHNRGAVLLQLRRYEEALASYDRALAAAPDDVDILTNRGVALYELKRYEDALACHDRALAITPDFAEAWSNRANVLFDLTRPAEAVASWERALAIKPDYAEAHSDLGLALRDQGRLDDAVAMFRKAIALKPEFAEAHSNLGLVLQDQGKLEEATASYRKALGIKPDFTAAYSNLLFLHAYQFVGDPPTYLALARGWEVACVPLSERQAARNRTFKRPPRAGRRLKVGYVSGDFRLHAVSYFIEQIFAHHDHARIELYAYSTNGERDEVTARFESLAEHWVSLVGASDTAILKRIEADSIDVLIDLSGHTAHNRMGVFARRAAPVQAQYLALGASGLTEMDYWIGDEILTPPDTDYHFNEQIWRLPRTWVSYYGKADAPLPGWRPAQDGIVQVGSFNNLNKLTPANFALWAKVLHALPEGRLLLKTKLLADDVNRRRIVEILSAHGIASNRIEMQDGSTTPDWTTHMAYYDRLDIALDPFGVMSGTTTTCDALWMGVPLVTLAGDRMASRMTASILNALGHPEWIAQSEAEYVGKVVTLARDAGLRKNLRGAQRSRMMASPLCNGHDLATSLENAYFAMFDSWLAKQTSAV